MAESRACLQGEERRGESHDTNMVVAITITVAL